MRLTLRSMLAYIDEVDELDPADHQEIGRKIEESEFATNLLHRIRDVSRRMRLDAPKPLGRGLGLDPNTVAEYLDNTLTGDRVPEFEKICLESDRHLAELASCHQILTLVLREPAEVDPGLRRRMYEIGAGGEPPKQDLEAELVGAGAVGSAAPPTEPRTLPIREKPEVPEYLRRGSKSRFWPITITIALALGLAFVVVSALGPLDGTNPALKWLLGGKKNDVAQTNPSPAAPPKVTPTAPVDDQKSLDKEGNPLAAPGDAHPEQNGLSTPEKTATPDKTASGKLPATSIEPTVPAAPGGAPDDNAKLTQPQSGAPIPPRPDDRTAPAAPLPPAIDAKGSELRPADKSAATVPQVPGVALPGDAGPAVPPAPVPAGAPASNPPTPAPPAPGTTDTNVVAPPGPPAAATAGRPLGRFPSDQQDVLLQMDAAHGQWLRMAPGSTLREGDKLLALPTFRPKISFGNGVSLMLFPETLIDLLGVDAQGIVAIRVEYGRLKVETPGKGDMRLRLSLGRAGGTLVFADPESAAAAEVHPYNYPGVDPEANPPHIGVVLYATGGQVDWIPDGGGDLPNAAGNRLKAPAALSLAPFAGSAGPERELPKWLATGVEPLSLLEARASQALNQALDGKETVTVALRELAGHRRTENRSLAARSLYLLDEFDALVDLLNDPDQKSIWDLQIDSVQGALDRSPNTAAKIRTTFERQIGKDGDDLYRMLWGYDKDQLQSGAAATLVDMLDVDNTAFSLAFRVVSFHDLRTITGATFNYRPEASAAGRSPAVRRWREQLKDGLIVPRGAPPAKPVAESPAGSLPPAAPPKAPPPPQPEE